MNRFERRTVLQAAAGLAATRVGLRLAGYRRWKHLLEQFARSHASRCVIERVEIPAVARDIARLEAAAARHLPFDTNCLEQSLVLCGLLELRGIQPKLRIGARKEADRFEAHAWVEVCGYVLNDGEEHVHFVPFEDSIPSAEMETI